MLRSKKFPWLSLTLLLFSNSILGWILATSESNWYMVVFVVAFVLLFAEILAAPASNSRKLITRWLSSDTRSFILVLILSFFAAALVIWIHVIARFLVLITAGLLARLDLHTVGLDQWQAFWILSVFSLAGVGLGWATHHYLFAFAIAD